nr:MAG TPA: hypothetical protein [Caudoviricetes sp.]
MSDTVYNALLYNLLTLSKVYLSSLRLIASSGDKSQEFI